MSSIEATPMSSEKQHQPIKRIFFAGVLVTLPSVITLYLFYWFATKIDQLGAYALSNFIPSIQQTPLLGLFGTVTIIFIVGLITSNYFGKKVYDFYESIFNKIPGINRVYYLFKKVLEMVLAPNRDVFKHPILVEFPRKGMWIIGFLSAKAPLEFCAKTEKELMSVFIPTTPNPTSGVLMLVPKEDIIMLDMTIEEASKVIISGGILTPETISQQQLIPSQDN